MALAPLFFDGPSSFLQVKRTTINFRIYSKFDQIAPLNAALELCPLMFEKSLCSVSATLAASFLAQLSRRLTR